MTTPARKQYLDMKNSHPDEILLFRMGDFYETFDEDARLISRELEIALTSRGFGSGKEKIPLAGIPYHSLESYLARLVRKGHRVAICEQTSDPKESTGIVDREVVRIVTPGTVLEDSLLFHNSNNYLCATIVNGDIAGLAYVDITTGEFSTTQLPTIRLPVELARLSPSEILIPSGAIIPSLEKNITTTEMDPKAFEEAVSREILLKHFAIHSLESYGCEHLPLAIIAAGAVLDYLFSTQKNATRQIRTLNTYSTNDHMVLDPQTTRNLELYEGGRWASANGSLFNLLDETKTSMGARLLKRWVGQPLLDIKALEGRQNIVEWFVSNNLRRTQMRTLLDSVSDLERLINKVQLSNATPRDLVSLGTSLDITPEMKHLLAEDGNHKDLKALVRDFSEIDESAQLIKQSIVSDPPLNVGDGKVIKKGFSFDLDEALDISRNAQTHIANMENKERTRSGIKSLKIGYNRVFGYYIEIRKTNALEVPDDYVRRQTLVNAERFITSELKEYESLILNAQDAVATLENSIFQQVCSQISDRIDIILKKAKAVAQIDVFTSLAEVAVRYKYVRPVLGIHDTIDIKDGRHPMVERLLNSGEFVDNDTFMSCGSHQLMILTGPNMAGKSTYIRQVAIITLMAQVGSFVPAESASIGIVDRIFTRVGLQDDLTAGQSTFMIEMVETASILSQASSNSLVILDEIGRGTSTYDGLAIAKAVAEYIHNSPKLGCKTLFATHYHELTQLATYLPRARNYNIAVSENNGDIIFLRQIVPGGANRSYGIHVARLAGLPQTVVSSALEYLTELEKESNPINMNAAQLPDLNLQLPLLKPSHKTVQELAKIDIESLTPLQAITKLFELKEMAESELNESE